jgi:hypothetical protein
MSASPVIDDGLRHSWRQSLFQPILKSNIDPALFEDESLQQIQVPATDIDLCILQFSPNAMSLAK